MIGNIHQQLVLAPVQSILIQLSLQDGSVKMIHIHPVFCQVPPEGLLPPSGFPVLFHVLHLLIPESFSTIASL